MTSKSPPLAQQVVREILAEIRAGQIARGDGLLPSEAALVRRFQVSRATLREALAQLADAGLIIRRHGVGTYVNHTLDDYPAAIEYWLDHTASFSDVIRTSGNEPQCDIIDAAVRPAGRLATTLAVDEAEPLLVVEKIFLSNGSPIIHCINSVPFELVDPAFTEAALARAPWLESIYRFLDRQCHSRVHHQKNQLFAVVAAESEARLMGCAVGDPLLKSSEVGYDKDMRPLFHGLNHFRADVVSFVQVRRATISIEGPGLR
jgi:GntR family transcriptional regulator